MIERLLWEIVDAGMRLTQLGALEGAAGNISVFIPFEAYEGDLLTTMFADASAWEPPQGATLPPGILFVTGAGRRLRDAARDPAVLCALVVDEQGWTLLRTNGSDMRPTSEIDTHIGIHTTVASACAGQVHSVVHAQPPHLTWLSHIPAYREFARLNRQLLRWQPETVVMLPEGIGVLPFDIPGTVTQGRMTADMAARHRLILWSKHGVVAHCAGGPLAATDLIDYAEAAARYEVLDIQAGRPADGMSLDEIRAVAERFSAASRLLERLPFERLK